MIVYLSVLIVCTAIGLVFVTNRRHHVVCCRRLLKRLYPYQLLGLDYLLDVPIDGREFWVMTHGARGLWKRWRNRVVLQQLYQARAEVDPVTEEEAREFMLRLARLNSSSYYALVFGLLRYSTPEKAGIYGQQCLLAYFELGSWVHAAFDEDGVHSCASLLAEIL